MLETAILCLALNVFHEARGENFRGQVAVAQVTMRRAEDDPRRVCKVVYEPKQFSWTNTRAVRRVRPKGEEWEHAKKVAALTAHKGHPDVTNGATHFHATRVSPYWRDSLKRTVKIGSHIFYKPKTK